MLKELIAEYRNLSLEIIKELDKDGFLNLENLLDKKDKIQEDIKNIKFEKNELKSLLEEFEILNLDKKIVEKINNKKITTRKKIHDIQRKKMASNSYGNAVNNVQFLNIKL